MQNRPFRLEAAQGVWLPVIRGRFVFRVAGEPVTRYEMAGSEWHLMASLRRISANGQQLEWFESAGCPLVPRSLAALNTYLRTRAMRFWRSGRYDRSDGHELIGIPEWQKFCRMLDLKFDGRGTGPSRELAQAPERPRLVTFPDPEPVNFRRRMYARQLEPA